MVYDDFILEENVDSDQVDKALHLLESQDRAAVTYLINTSLPLMTSDSESVFVPLKDRIRSPQSSILPLFRDV